MDCTTFFAPGQIIVRPTPDQPGTLSQQFAACDVHYCDPLRRRNSAAAWKRARAAVLPHARREAEERARAKEVLPSHYPAPPANDAPPAPQPPVRPGPASPPTFAVTATREVHQ